MENVNETNVLSEVNQSFAEQSKACNSHCRKTVYIVVITAWGLLIQSSHMSFINRVLLLGTVLLCVVFFIIETWRYFQASKSTLSILSKNITKKYLTENETSEICKEMLKISTWTHRLMKMQIGLCFVLVVLLGIFILNYSMYR